MRKRGLKDGLLSCALAACGIGFSPSAPAQTADASTRVETAQPILGAVAISGAYGHIEDNRDGFLGDARWHQETLSGSMQIRKITLGFSVSYNSSEKDLDEHSLGPDNPDAGARVFGGTTESTSVSLLGNVGGYVGRWFLQGFFGYADGETDEFREGGGEVVTWDRDFDSNTLGINVSTLMGFGESWYFSPNVQLIRFETTSDATVDSLGQDIAEDRDVLVQGRVGGELGYQALFSDMVATVGVRPYFVYDFRRFEDFNDRSAVDLTGFLTLAGERFVAGVEILGTLGRTETDSVSGRLFLGSRF